MCQPVLIGYFSKSESDETNFFLKVILKACENSPATLKNLEASILINNNARHYNQISKNPAENSIRSAKKLQQASHLIQFPTKKKIAISKRELSDFSIQDMFILLFFPHCRRE